MSYRAAATLLALTALAACGPAAKKPADADVAAYLAQSEPTYLQVSGVKTSFEAISTLGRKNLPAGSWRVHVDFTLHAREDLYAPQTGYRERRADFERAVAAVEQYRVARIAAVERLAKQLGLMKQDDAAPEPAVPLTIVTHEKQDLADSVTLLAQPDGAGWKFAQLSEQALADDAIGAPVADMRSTHPHAVFVIAGSAEEQDYTAREARFLDILRKSTVAK